MVIIVVIIIIVVAVNSGEDKEEKYNTVIIERSDLVQTVSETGQVVSDPQINLGFQTNGIIENIFYNIGDTVLANELITNLESNDQAASIAQSKAALDSAQAALNLKLAGATQEEIDVAKANVEIAETALNTAINNLEIVKSTAEQNIKNAEVALEKAKINLNLTDRDQSQMIQDAYDNMFISLGTILRTIYNEIQVADTVLGFDKQHLNNEFERQLSVRDRQLLIDANNFCPGVYTEYKKTNEYYQTLNINFSHSKIDNAITKVNNTLQDTDKCLYLVRKVLENSTDFTTPKTSLTTLTNNIDTSISNIRSAINTFETKDQAIASAKNSYDISNQDYQAALQNLETAKVEAENQIKTAELEIQAKESALAAREAELQLKTADPRPVDLAQLYANIDSARANLNADQYALRKTQISAPVKGVISKIEYNRGENISAFTKMISMITPKPKIEVNVPESDIAKVKLDDPVKITLDAFSQDTVFQGKVIFIEPAETEISGVTYYQVDVIFTDTLEKNIKPGMTADLIITTDKKENTLSVPHRAILKQKNKKTVRVLKNGEIKKVEVQTGLRGDSNTEIISGLSEGDEVITFIKENDKESQSFF